MSLADRLEEGFAANWRPDDNDAPEGSITVNPLFGRFKRMESGNTQQGQCWIMVLDQTDSEGTELGNEVAVWLFHSILRNELKRIAPKPGALLAIRKDGKEKTADGKRTVIKYTVRSDQVVQEDFSWDRLSPEDDNGRVVYPGHEGDAAALQQEQATQAAAAPAPAEPAPAPAAEDDDIPF